MSEGSVLEDVYAALGGNGHRCVGPERLIEFAETLSMRGAWIDIVETFESVGAVEMARLDLSMYGDHGADGVPNLQRQQLALQRLRALLARVTADGGEFIFYIWADQARLDV
jgi:hypothetical protein